MEKADRRTFCKDYHSAKTIIQRGVNEMAELIDKNDLHAAIDALNTFTKAWCMDRKKTAENNEPVFRCYDCPFIVAGEGTCRIKVFCYKQDDEYTRSVDFGSMGCL